MSFYKKIKDQKNGFTLVELIVVLVILAILMAILIPSFTGYIDKARRTQAQMEATAILRAAQAAASEQYAENSSAETLEEPYLQEAKDLSEVGGTVGTIAVQKNTGKITSLYYESTNGYDCTYTAANSDPWSIVKK